LFSLDLQGAAAGKFPHTKERPLLALLSAAWKTIRKNIIEERDEKFPSAPY
jgi:hypothetical protein